MIVCPICEHQQQAGLECEVCGKDLSSASGLAGLGPPPAPAQRVDGLETTLPERAVGDVAVERLSDLELNAFGKVEVAPERTPDLQPSANAPVGEVPVEQVPDLAQDRAPDDGMRTAAPSGQVVCRYCRNVQAAGTLCERCGMRLPKALRIESKTAAPESMRCRACGAPGAVGERCKECGRVVAAADT